MDGTYGTQLAKERAEIGATRSAELFFEEIEVDEDVRYCVFVYLVDSSIREEVLYIRIRVVSIILFNSSSHPLQRVALGISISPGVKG